MPSGGAIDSVGVVVTADCNLRCRYCYQDRKQPASMSWSALSTAVDRVRHRGTPARDAVVPRRRAAAGVPADRPCRQAYGPALPRAPAPLRSDDERPAAHRTAHRVPRASPLRGADQLRRRAGRRRSSARQGASRQLDRLLDRMRSRHRAFFRRRVTLAATVTARTIPFLADSFAYLLEKGPRGNRRSAPRWAIDGCPRPRSRNSIGSSRASSSCRSNTTGPPAACR